MKFIIYETSSVWIPLLSTDFNEIFSEASSFPLPPAISHNLYQSFVIHPRYSTFNFKAVVPLSMVLNHYLLNHTTLMFSLRIMCQRDSPTVLKIIIVFLFWEFLIQSLLHMVILSYYSLVSYCFGILSEIFITPHEVIHMGCYIICTLTSFPRCSAFFVSKLNSITCSIILSSVTI